MSDSLLSTFGPGDLYPERHDHEEEGTIERLGAAYVGWAKRLWRARAQRPRDIVDEVGRAEAMLGKPELAELADRARDVALLLRSEGMVLPHCARAFALVRHAAGLTLGKSHFDVQLMGGWVMLQGMVAEMDTGEGKTLTATLPAATAALAGWPVHIITVNDYLVERDSELMRPIYEALGLTVAAVTIEMSHEERRAAYASDIVYVSNKTVVFDYLRDRIVLGANATPIQLQLERMAGANGRSQRLLLHGLHFAIVDEADSVLGDEARTPLIISAEAGNNDDERIAREALELARQLTIDIDYRVRRAERRILLTEAGRQHIIDLCHGRSGIWAIGIRREELALRALSAEHLYVLDEHYLVRDGKVQVVDEFTGRVMPDRSWSQGLHQIIEIKEGCAVTTVRDTLARISYQRFFRRYLKLCGMTGTAREVRNELGTVYDLPVVRIPTNRPSQRRYLRDQVFHGNDLKWKAIAGRVVELHARGVPVLIGTRSVSSSEHAARILGEHGLSVVILNAKQDASEAETVAQAGEPGRITIATNMAGRGTDIALHPDVRDRGGLHVILTERHEAGRIDRQLAGRAARQGDQGSFEAILSLEDALLLQVRGHPLDRILRSLAVREGGVAQWAMRTLTLFAQKRTERAHSRVRLQLLKSDRSTSNSLSFAGRSE